MLYEAADESKLSKNGSCKFRTCYPKAKKIINNRVMGNY